MFWGLAILCQRPLVIRPSACTGYYTAPHGVPCNPPYRRIPHIPAPSRPLIARPAPTGAAHNGRLSASPRPHGRMGLLRDMFFSMCYRPIDRGDVGYPAHCPRTAFGAVSPLARHTRPPPLREVETVALATGPGFLRWVHSTTKTRTCQEVFKTFLTVPVRGIVSGMEKGSGSPSRRISRGSVSTVALPGQCCRLKWLFLQAVTISTFPVPVRVGPSGPCGMVTY